MADKKDYPNRRVLSLEEVEAIAGGAIGVRPTAKNWITTIEGTSDEPTNVWFCLKCNRRFETCDQLRYHESNGCGRNNYPYNK